MGFLLLLLFFFAKMGQVVRVEDYIGGEVVLSRPISLFSYFKKIMSSC